MGQLAATRREAIRRQLVQWGRVSTADLAPRFKVSERTIQRDLDVLAATVPATRRVHGGLITAAPQAGPPGLRIGMLVPVRDYYYSDVIAGASAAAEELGVRLVVADYVYREDLESAALHRFGEVALDALIATVDYESCGYQQLRSLGLPTVVLERPWHPQRMRVSGPAVIDHVFSDHQAGASIGLQHLVELGHRSIWCLIRTTATSVGLVRGLRAAADVLSDAAEIKIIEIASAHGGEPPAASESIADQVIDGCRTGRVTALFVHADQDALALHRAVQAAGIAVPGELSIIAYDDVILATEGAQLSAVSPRRRWLGRIGLETVVDRLRSYGQRSYVERPGLQLSLTPELIVRSSTAAVQRSGRHVDGVSETTASTKSA
jgi:DNA-binding LacI/PurR family transcriptional regulator